MTLYNSSAIILAMKLTEYLKTTGITQTQFAESLGVSQGLVHQWIKGITKITGERAVQIEQVTGKAIKREELRPKLFIKEAA